VGAGTQRIEECIASQFPQVVCARFDRDSTSRKGTAEALLSDFSDGIVRFLIGTQMLAKGHDFKRVGLVVVVSADVTMNLPDFRSAERTFQILTQVAGRAGRSDVPGKVLIQTHNPDHHALAYVAGHDFMGFYDVELALRQELGYPPFSRLGRVVVEARRREAAEQAARALAETAAGVARILKRKVEVMGPSRAPISRIRNVHRWHMILKGDSRRPLAPFVRECIARVASNASVENARFSVDIDPQSMM
jgi:primosomal protein N' (replication factor Y)